MDGFNLGKNRAVGTPFLKSEAVFNFKTARGAPAEAANGLETIIQSAIGAKVILTKTLWQEVGLANGI